MKSALPPMPLKKVFPMDSAVACPVRSICSAALMVLACAARAVGVSAPVFSASAICLRLENVLCVPLGAMLKLSPAAGVPCRFSVMPLKAMVPPLL